MTPTNPLRLVQISDVHLWRYTVNPVLLMNKRAIGVLDLLRGRAGKFQLERLEDVVARIQAIAPDHLLITGDLTTTALPAEFHAARRELDELLAEPERVSVVPGNHDRYTRHSMKTRTFEKFFGPYMPSTSFPWMRRIDGETGVLGLDPTRAHISARGYLPPEQMERASRLVTEARRGWLRRLIVACHYPILAPAGYQRELEHKRLKNADEARAWASTIGPHLWCCGHVHAAWAFRPKAVPNQLCLNPGAPLYRDRKGKRLPGFLEIGIDGNDVAVTHQAWDGSGWRKVVLDDSPGFFTVI
jgi:3',5'-cyclic AMP phosphodiesterase CpdA